GGDRQELGCALDDPQHERLPVGELPGRLPHPERGECERERERGGREKNRKTHTAHAHEYRQCVTVGARVTDATAASRPAFWSVPTLSHNAVHKLHDRLWKC